jgi:hypothetical protein
MQVLQENEAGAVKDLQEICSSLGALKGICDDFIADEAPKVPDVLLRLCPVGQGTWA